MCVEHYQFKCSGLKAYLKDIDPVGTGCVLSTTSSSVLDSKLILKISTLYQFMCCGLKAYLKDMRFAPSSCVVDLKLILKICDSVQSAQAV